MPGLTSSRDHKMTLTLEQPLQTTFSHHGDMIMAKSVSWDKFLKQGLPTKKEEHWKYTDLAAIYQKYHINCVKLQTELTNHDLLTKLDLSIDAHHFIFIDGTLVRADQHPSILLHKALPAFEPHQRIQHSTMLLARATAIAGLHLEIKDHATLDKPIQINYIHSRACDHKVANYQNIIQLSQAAHCQVYENFISISDQYSAININTKILLAENAHYCYDFLSTQQQEKLVLTNTVMAEVGKNAQFETFQLSANSALTRFDFIIDLQAKQAVFNATGICTIAEKSHSDYHFYVNHLASDTSSKVDFRAIVSGKAKMVFNAKGYVAKGIQNVNVLQNNRNIQLSDTAEVNTKPELEIYSDDVICTHAATIGALDQQALFYLQSRGISYDKAVQLLLKGFVSAMITGLSKSPKIITDYLEILNKALLSLE